MNISSKNFSLNLVSENRNISKKIGRYKYNRNSILQNYENLPKFFTIEISLPGPENLIIRKFLTTPY